jgi:hypothetical protein
MQVTSRRRHDSPLQRRQLGEARGDLLAGADDRPLSQLVDRRALLAVCEC